MSVSLPLPFREEEEEQAESEGRRPNKGPLGKLIAVPLQSVLDLNGGCRDWAALCHISPSFRHPESRKVATVVLN